jgi:hypothetical protein
LVGLFFGVAAAVSAESDLHALNERSFYAVIETDLPMSNASSLTLSRKIEALSEVLLNAGYLDGSLGEDAQGKYDKDPLVRFDVFDCTTFVEAVLAGALSETVADFMPNLMKLRYKDGLVSFVSRNHFPSLDWIPNNQNVLADITKLIAGKSLAFAKTTIDKPAWYNALGYERLSCADESSERCRLLLAQLHDEGRAFKAQGVTTPYVPLSALSLDDGVTINQALLDRIPSGSVINMVRPNWQLKDVIGTNMNVSHQAIAIRKNGELYLRHASQTHMNVMDVGLLEYFSQYTSASSLKGFNVQVLKSL